MSDYLVRTCTSPLTLYGGKMKINKRILIYRTQMTEGWAEPTEEGAVYLEILSRFNDRKIDGMLSCTKFPKSILAYQVQKMLGRIGVPYLENCIIGRWGYKKLV